MWSIKESLMGMNRLDLMCALFNCIAFGVGFLVMTAIKLFIALQLL